MFSVIDKHLKLSCCFCSKTYRFIKSQLCTVFCALFNSWSLIWIDIKLLVVC